MQRGNGEYSVDVGGTKRDMRKRTTRNKCTWQVYNGQHVVMHRAPWPCSTTHAYLGSDGYVYDCILRPPAAICPDGFSLSCRITRPCKGKARGEDYRAFFGKCTDAARACNPKRNTAHHGRTPQRLARFEFGPSAMAEQGPVPVGGTCCVGAAPRLAKHAALKVKQP